jgi:hypothetical protein
LRPGQGSNFPATAQAGMPCQATYLEEDFFFYLPRKVSF